MGSNFNNIKQGINLESIVGPPANLQPGDVYFDGYDGQLKFSADGLTTQSAGSLAISNDAVSIAPFITTMDFSSPIVASASGLLATISVSQATSLIDGYLTASDWSIFNAKQPAGNYITGLTSDVTASGPGIATATVNFVGGKSASSIQIAVDGYNVASSTNTANTLVTRDSSGNFSAGIITASLNGNVTGNVSGSSSTFTGSLSGDVTGTQSSTVVSTVGGKTSTQIATTVDGYNAASSSNIASTLVKRDSSGNFSAGTITATLNGYALYLAPWLVKTSPYTVVAGERILADTSSGPFILTLPALPSNGDTVCIVDAAGTWGSNNLSINPGSKTINNVGGVFLANTSYKAYELVYYSNNWIIVTARSTYGS